MKDDVADDKRNIAIGSELEHAQDITGYKLTVPEIIMIANT